MATKLVCNNCNEFRVEIQNHYDTTAVTSMREHLAECTSRTTDVVENTTTGPSEGE